ncbi:MAG: bifunctional lysylphosphatidylglycerol flippase/synthetase MprF [Chloroflexota bacterium]
MTLDSNTARRAGAVLTALIGFINILSALYPAIPGRIELLRDVLPMHLIRGSQTATVLVGFALILLADGLRKRRRRAMQIVVALLTASIVLNLSKGLDFEEAIGAGALAVGLILYRQAFQVSGIVPEPRRLLQRIATFTLMYYSYLLLGFLVLGHRVRPAPTFVGVTLEPFRMLWSTPLYQFHTAQGRWFHLSLSVTGILAGFLVLTQILRPFVPHRTASTTDLARVRELVRRYGSDTLSYFAFQHGRSYFFDDSGEAFLSYRLWGTVAIVGGHPIGAPERIPHLINRFLEFSTSSGIEPCFLGIGGSNLGVYARAGLRTLKVGEEALIDLPDFDATLLKRKVRRAARHIHDAGITVTGYRRDALPAAIAHQMEGIHRAWIRERGGNERGFSMTLGRLPEQIDADCEIMVAVEGDHLWGYLCLVPAYSGSAWSLDAMRRRAGAPNGLMEALVIAAAESYRERGYRTLSLNFATLSNSENNIDSKAVESTRRFLYEHLSSVYQLKSLAQFNGKFLPRWQSRYLAYRDVTKIPKVAIAIAQSEDPIKIPSPVTLLRR